MAKIVKLGKKAYSFSDPQTGLSIANKQVVELTKEQRLSGRVQKAIAGGHLREATSKELEDFTDGKIATSTSNKPQGNPAQEALVKDLDLKTKAELSDYYEDNYEVDDSDIEAFEKLNKKDMVKFLVESEFPQED